METIEHDSRRCAPSPREGVVGLVPTMGALHDGHAALFRAARAECDVVVASVFVNPAQFARGGRPRRVPARPRARRGVRGRARRRRRSSRRPPRRCTRPGSRPGSSRPAPPTGSRATHRPGHFRGVATVCLKLFNIVRPQLAYFGRKDAQQVAVVKQVVRDLDLELEIRVVADRPRRRRARALVAQRAPRPRRARARARDPARARDARPRPRARRPRRGRDRARLRRRRRPRRPHARDRRARRLDAPDRQRPPGRSA